jgi:hypothetical protein
MVRAAEPTPDGHSRPYLAAAHLDFVFMPVTQQRSMTILHTQFPRHGGDGEQRRQAFYPLPPIKMSCGGLADILKFIIRHLSIFFHHSHRKPQLQGRCFGRKSRFQSTHSFGDALHALDGAVNFRDFIPFPLKMHRRPSDSQHPRNLGVGFVQIPADDFEPLNGQGALPLESRFDLHRPAVMYRIYCRKFKHYSIARFVVF